MKNREINSFPFFLVGSRQVRANKWVCHFSRSASRPIAALALILHFLPAAAVPLASSILALPVAQYRLRVKKKDDQDLE